jgi:hypothetical protein
MRLWPYHVLTERTDIAIRDTSMNEMKPGGKASWRRWRVRLGQHLSNKQKLSYAWQRYEGTLANPSRALSISISAV